jgi:hypothetical protein
LLLCGKDLRERKKKIGVNSKASLLCLRLEVKKKNIYIYIYINNVNHSGVETLLSKKKEIRKIIKAMPPVILLLGKKRKNKINKLRNRQKHSA